MSSESNKLSVDLRVTELISSRLCHDLVGPIGAVGNGLELMEDEGPGMAQDALALAAKSAGQASNLLQFYRLAYGMAGNIQGTEMTTLKTLAENFLGHTKTTLDWAVAGAISDLPEGSGKLLLNLVAMAAEGLPRGGTIKVAAGPGGSGVALQVTAEGTDAGLRPESKAGLADDVKVEELSPRNVHGYFTRLLAKRMGGRLSYAEPGQGRLYLEATLPA